MSKLLDWISLLLLFALESMLIFGTIFLLIKDDLLWAMLGVVDVSFVSIITYYGMTLGTKVPEPTL